MIEDIQKVNKMAQELLNQGIASDREDAVKKAQEMLNKDISQTPAISVSNKIEAPTNDIEYCKNMIQRTREQMAKQIDIFTEKMNEIIKEINYLKDQLSRGNIKPASESNNPSNYEARQEKQATLKKNEPHPKRGEFKSDDVSIEKIFYFGNK